MNIIELIKIAALSLVEGITEWLPVSSTGHMIIFDEIVKLNILRNAEFKSLFLVVIQLGAILAVVYLYFEKLNPFSSKKTRYEKARTWSLWTKVLVACLPAAVIGVLFGDEIDDLLENPFIVSLMLIIYGIAFIVIERKNRIKPREVKVSSLTELSYADAAKIGAVQLLALIPGTSRSGSTILGSLLMGVSRPVATEFSFFLGIPVMFGASLLKIVKYGLNFTITEIAYLIFATTLTFWISIFAIKFLMKYIKKNDFEPFGWYRIALGIVVILFFVLIK